MQHSVLEETNKTHPSICYENMNNSEKVKEELSKPLEGGMRDSSRFFVRCFVGICYLYWFNWFQCSKGEGGDVQRKG